MQRAQRNAELWAGIAIALVVVATGGNIQGATLASHVAQTALAIAAFGVAVWWGVWRPISKEQAQRPRAQAAGLNQETKVPIEALDSAPVFRPGRLLSTPLDLGWLAFALTMLVTTLATDPRRGLEAWVFPFALQVPLFYGLVILRRKGWAAVSWIRVILLIAAAMCLQDWLWAIGFFGQWNGLHPPADMAVYAPLRLYGVLDNPNVFGAFLALAFPVAVGYFFWTSILAERGLIIVWIILAGVTLTATGSRGAQVAALIGIFAVMVAIGGQRGWFARRKAVPYAVGAVLVVLLLALIVVESNAAGRENSNVRRLELWKTALTAGIKRPLTGFGMGGFPVAQMVTQSVPPSSLERHAHNLFLNFLAEGGLPGLAGLLVWGGLLAIVGWRTWKAAAPRDRLFVAGISGGLIALAVVGLFDDPLAQPAPFALATLLAALLVTQLSPPSARAATQGRSYIAIWRRGGEMNLLISGAACALAIFLTIRYGSLWTASHTAIDGNPSSQLAQVQALDRAAATDPTDALVQSEAAGAWAGLLQSPDAATLAGGQSLAFDATTARYQNAVRLDPTFSVQRVNLAVLLLDRGDPANALLQFSQAVELAPESALMHLNYGIGLEAAGQTDQAITEYKLALSLNQRWRDALFWQTTVPRRTAWQSAIPTSAQAMLRAFLDSLQTGDTALKAGNRSDAANAYSQAYTQAVDDTGRAIAGGMASYARGDVLGARYNLRTAIALNGEDATRALIYLGDIETAQGHLDAATNDYQSAFARVDRYGLFGPGHTADTIYAVNVFGREAAIADYLPDVMMLDITPDFAARFVVLAHAEALAGQRDTAIYTYQRILRADPGYQPAEQGLSSLGAS